jgi:predicted  nucleic acid-binding Zn-ribbon protein
MADDKLDIRKAIADNAHVSDLSNLARSGVRKVKVLDEEALQELIQRAVDQAITSQTQEERTRLLADSRKQLQKLMNERDEFYSRAGLLEAGKNELIQQVEKLQSELKLRRQVEEEGGSLQAQVAEHEKKSGELQDENAWLRQEHDRMVEELDRAQTEIKELKEEIEKLRRELEQSQGEVGELSDRVAREAGRGKELEEARTKANSLRQEIDDLHQAGETATGAIRHELDRAREGQHSAEGRLKEGQEELDLARQEIVRLNKELEALRNARESTSGTARQELDRVREETHAEATRRAQVEARLKEAQVEISRLRGAGEPKRPEPPPTPPPSAPHPAAPARGLSGGQKAGKGLDIGTVNLVAAEQNDAGDVELRLQRNVFIDVEITAYTKAMLTRLNVPYVVQGQRMYIMGDSAFQLANVLNRRTRRPMKDGLISPKEQDALPIMKLLIGSILGDPRIPGEVCFYSVPGEPVDSDLSVAYHRDLFDAVLKSLGYKPSHILEGHAVTFGELADEDFTGIGVSCGGGMFNVCVAYKSMPALTFSTARSGDWVDLNVAQALGIKPEKAALIKEQGVDLTTPKTREEDAIAIYYRNLIQYNISNIAERFRSAENMPTFNDPISIVFSGGTSMAGHFIELVKDVFTKIDFPIPVKEIRLAKDPLNATAKGALVAAQLEMANEEAS